jgi:gamma-glutamyltranspeptidase/glutathione hydrolase
MMTPTIVLERGRPRLVLGSAGSVRLAGAIAQVVWNVVHGELSVEEAVGAPRLHIEGSQLQLEGGWPGDAAAALESTGPWTVVRWADRNLYFGGVAAVEVLPDGSMAAAGDPRRGGRGIVVA